MKFSAVLPLAMAFAAQAAPSPDTAAIQTFQDAEGKTWVGDASAALTARGIEARCSCAPECYGTGHSCTPGDCQCAGHNGCWSYNGGPFICQIGPNGPAK